MALTVTRSRMEGFIVLDYAPRFAEGVKALSGWMAEGRLKSIEDVQEGLENAPATLRRLFEGKNFGKQLLRL
jgi:NADPH-dependent curcumin reductase CurA